MNGVRKEKKKACLAISGKGKDKTAIVCRNMFHLHGKTKRTKHLLQ
jgi:hypothetical protein